MKRHSKRIKNEADLARVPDGENSNRDLTYQEAVQSHIARRAVRDHEFPDVVVNAPPQQRVCVSAVITLCPVEEKRYVCSTSWPAGKAVTPVHGTTRTPVSHPCVKSQRGRCRAPKPKVTDRP